MVRYVMEKLSAYDKFGGKSNPYNNKLTMNVVKDGNEVMIEIPRSVQHEAINMWASIVDNLPNVGCSGKLNKFTNQPKQNEELREHNAFRERKQPMMMELGNVGKEEQVIPNDIYDVENSFANDSFERQRKLRNNQLMVNNRLLKSNLNQTEEVAMLDDDDSFDGYSNQLMSAEPNLSRRRYNAQHFPLIFRQSYPNNIFLYVLIVFFFVSIGLFGAMMLNDDNGHGKGR